MAPPTRSSSKASLLEAALHVIRAKGYAAATIDDICQGAGVTKGSFFHHFKSKDELAVAAAQYFSARAEGLFAAAAYHQSPDPLQRVLGYVELRSAMLTGELPDFTCLLGTLVQETYATHPAIREACAHGMASHIAELTRDIESAKQLYAPTAVWSAESVGYFIQAVLQGSFIFAKAEQTTEVALANLGHLRHYLSLVFNLDLASVAGEVR
jgi:TetR/AcrR family transcriptional repressor of nem operon